MRKVIDAIAIVSFLLSGTVVGLIGYAYLTLTNEKKQEEMLKKRQSKKESMEKNKNEKLDLYKNKLDIVAQLDQYLNN